MNLLRLSFKSWRLRKIPVALAITSIALASMLFFSVEKVRSGIKESFAHTISDTDLVVGPRSSALNVLLNTVFHAANNSNMISYDTFLHFKNNPRSEWAVPISFGDNYRGNRMVGTNDDFFKYYQYRNKKHLAFLHGRKLKGLYDTVLGYSVAKKFNHKLGDSIVLAHGLSEAALLTHTDSPFTIVGILKKTNTPVDRSVIVSLEAVEAIHENWLTGGYQKSTLTPEQKSKLTAKDFKIEKVSAFLLKTKSRMDVLTMQREINEYKKEPLSAAMPAMTLATLWKNLGSVETALFTLSILTGILSLLSMLISILSSLSHRRREIAILRSLGAGKLKIFSLLSIESLALTVIGVGIGFLLTYVGIMLFQGSIESLSGIFISITAPDIYELLFIFGMIIASVVLAILPGVLAYRMTLHDGLSVR